MKKILYLLVALGSLSLVSCSDEDELPTINYKGCQVCEVEGTAPNFVPEDYEVCVVAETIEDDTTVDVAYVDGASTGIVPERYFELFCENAYVPIPSGGGNNGGGTPGENPGNGTGTNCVTCAAYTMMGVNVPAQAVCKASNGNAIVDGNEMSMTYDMYLQTQGMLTTCN